MYFNPFFMAHSPPTIGILGGLGPETTAHFYTDLIQQSTQGVRPRVCMWSLPLDIHKEQEYIASGQHGDHYRELLAHGAQALEQAGADAIVIPCNTVHEFYDDLVKKVNVPIVNLLEVVADEIERREWQKALVLATSRTIQTKLYQRALAVRDIEIVLPDTKGQQALDQLIGGLLTDGASVAHERSLHEIIRETGVDHVVLGCTDLQLILPPSEDVIDSMQALVEHTSQRILHLEKQ